MHREHSHHRAAAWVAAAVLLLVLPALGACGGTQNASAGTPVTSGDGHATVVIPKGALPAGTKLSDVRIKALAVTAPGVLAAYQLEPDGLQLTHPVTLRLHLDHAPSGAVALEHVSSDGSQVELLSDEPSPSPDPSGNGGFTFTASLSHFSDAVLVESDAVQVAVDPAPDVAVGQRFSLRAHVHWSDVQVSTPSGPDALTIAWSARAADVRSVSVDWFVPVNSPVTIAGGDSGIAATWFGAGKFNYVEKSVAVGPDNPVDPAIIPADFQCMKPGSWAAKIRAYVQYPTTVTESNGKRYSFGQVASEMASKVVSGECLPAPATPATGGAGSSSGAAVGGGSAGSSGSGGSAGAKSTATPTSAAAGGGSPASGATPSSDATGAPVAGTETSQNCPKLPNGVRHGEYEYGPYRCDGNVIIRVMIWNGHEFPIYQFRKAPPDICAYDHYHAIGGIGYALDGTDMKEMGYPQEGCGFGVAGASAPATLTQAQWDAWVNEHPAH